MNMLESNILYKKLIKYNTDIICTHTANCEICSVKLKFIIYVKLFQ